MKLLLQPCPGALGFPRQIHELEESGGFLDEFRFRFGLPENVTVFPQGIVDFSGVEVGSE